VCATVQKQHLIICHDAFF